jgi:hypothetical protein
MRKTILAAAIGILALSGCASNNYQQYVKAQENIATARAEADIARYKALEAIANRGDTTARVAAVIALQQGAPQTNSSPKLEQPTSVGDIALRWASVLVPSLTQIYGIGKSTDVAITHSNNSVESQKSTNSMIVDLVQGRPTPIVGNRTDGDGATEDFLLYPR